MWAPKQCRNPITHLLLQNQDANMRISIKQVLKLRPQPLPMLIGGKSLCQCISRNDSTPYLSRTTTTYTKFLNFHLHMIFYAKEKLLDYSKYSRQNLIYRTPQKNLRCIHFSTLCTQLWQAYTLPFSLSLQDLSTLSPLKLQLLSLSSLSSDSTLALKLPHDIKLLRRRIAHKY